MELVHLINKKIKAFGFQIKKYPNVDMRRRFALMNLHNIDVVFDVGANVGQYANDLLFNDFKGIIHSFEPLSHEYEIIKKKSLNINNWEVYNYALGDVTENIEINVSKNKVSSSILTLTKDHLSAASESIVIGKEVILVKRLEDVIQNFNLFNRSPMLKIDTQGYEYKVLIGAGNLLDQFKIIQVELSLSTMYDGEKNYQEIIEYLSRFDFRLVSIEPGFFNANSGELLQFDGIFCKKL